jgi:hypothetical protein
VTLRLLARRCGPLSKATTTRIQALELKQLEALAEAMLDFGGPQDLATWLAASSRAPVKLRNTKDTARAQSQACGWRFLSGGGGVSTACRVQDAAGIPQKPHHRWCGFCGCCERCGSDVARIVRAALACSAAASSDWRAGGGRRGGGHG